jgi:hypothetical protein
MAMVEDAQVRNYRPTFVIDQHGIMRYSDTPLLAGLPDRDLTSAVALNAAVEPSLISSSN